MFFFKGRKKDNGPDRALLDRLNGKSLRYVTLRQDGDYKETVIGKGGSLNIRNGEVIIVCDCGEVLKRPLAELSVGELLSNDGATFEFVLDGRKQTVVAYYTYYRQVN